MLNQCTTGHTTTSEMRTVPCSTGGDVVCWECFQDLVKPEKRWDDCEVFAQHVPSFAIPVEWTIRGTLLIHAQNLEEAHYLAESEIKVFPGPNVGAVVKGHKILLSEAVKA